jgi:glutaredoxin
MWEAFDLGDENLLWSCIAFNGGIAGQQQAPCGAVSAGAVCAGLLHRCPPGDKQAAKQARLDARQAASDMVKGFTERFGTIACRDLVGYDFSTPDGYRQFQESGVWKEKCDNCVQFVIEKLYESKAKGNPPNNPQKAVIYTKPGCPYCANAKKDMEERGIPYHEISTHNNAKAVEEVKRLSKGSGIVPVIVSGEEVKVGFNGG